MNGSTATATEDDHTVRKWIGFTKIHGGRRFIVGNAFAYRATLSALTTICTWLRLLTRQTFWFRAGAVA